VETLRPELRDLMRVVDQLDDVLHRAKVVPLTSQIRVERGEVASLLDQLRMSIARLANADSLA